MSRTLRRFRYVAAPMAGTGLCWHYTVGVRFREIMAEGLIRPATAMVPAGERPAVWFSTEPEWEVTANKSIMTLDGRRRSGSRADTERVGGGLVRIGVALATAPHTWSGFRRHSGIDKRRAKGLEQAGIEAGADPRHWRVSFAAVPRAKWLTVDVWDSGQWVPIPFGPLLGTLNEEKDGERIE